MPAWRQTCRRVPAWCEPSPPHLGPTQTGCCCGQVACCLRPSSWIGGRHRNWMFIQGFSWGLNALDRPWQALLICPARPGLLRASQVGRATWRCAVHAGTHNNPASPARCLRTSRLLRQYRGLRRGAMPLTKGVAGCAPVAGAGDAQYAVHDWAGGLRIRPGQPRDRPGRRQDLHAHVVRRWQPLCRSPPLPDAPPDNDIHMKIHAGPASAACKDGV